MGHCRCICLRIFENNSDGTVVFLLKNRTATLTMGENHLNYELCRSAGHYLRSVFPAEFGICRRFCSDLCRGWEVILWCADCMAEGEGFEPPVPFQVQRFSRPPVSTAHASLRACLIRSLAVFISPSHRRLWGLCRGLPQTNGRSIPRTGALLSKSTHVGTGALACAAERPLGTSSTVIC